MVFICGCSYVCGCMYACEVKGDGSKYGERGWRGEVEHEVMVGEKHMERERRGCM